MAARASPQRVKKHFSYSVDELARLLGVHKNTIGNWEREGLAPLDGKRPKLFAGSEVRAFLEARRKARKKPCQPGTLYCLRCQQPRKPKTDVVEYMALRSGSGNLKGNCGVCGGSMRQRIREADILKKLPDCTVQSTQAQPSLIGKGDPSLNCEDERKG